MKPTLPPKSPRMSPHKLHHEHEHPVIPVTQPQQEIIIDKHEEDGREVGGIVYHPLGKGPNSGQRMERIRINEGMGEGAGWEAGSGPDMTQHYQSPRQGGGGREIRGGGDGGHMDHGLDLQRQPHRDTQETGPSPLPLPAAMTARHHPSANHHHHHHPSHHHPQAHVNTNVGGPRLYIQPPTPGNPSPPPALQIRSLNTPPLTRDREPNVNSNNEGTGGKYEGAVVGGASEGGEGMMSRFKTTFLSKNKGPMSKTWARKSYLDELESMAPSSPTSTSPRNYRSAPVTPHGHGYGDGEDLESGRQGMRRITRDQRELPRARSVYASPIALAQFKALPPMNPQGETMVAPR